jgi:hypothetical protein
MWSHKTLRTVAYLTALLVGASWISRALLSMEMSLFDLGTNGTGGIILTLAGTLDFAPATTVKFAHSLAGLKLLLGIYLFAAVLYGLYELVMRRESDDALLDVTLFVAALGAGIAAIAAIPSDAMMLRTYIGELFLCLGASALAALSRARQPRPAPEPAAAKSDAVIDLAG